MATFGHGVWLSQNTINYLTYSANNETLYPSKPTGSDTIKTNLEIKKMANIIETINSFGADFLTHKVGADYCEGKLVTALKTTQEPSWDMYKTWLDAFKAQRPESVSDATCLRQWNRLVKQAEVTIPKSTEAEAVAKQNQREAQAKKFADIPDAELIDKIKKLKELDPTVAKPYEREQERRVKEANKPIAEAIKATQSRIREALKGCSDMKKLEAALKALA